MMKDDMALLREYAASRSDLAFEELVTRYLGLVYSAALRRVGDVQLAEEIAQAVFIILARKSGSLGAKTILSGWLYRATGYAAADALKSQRRRQHREQEAYMQSLMDQPASDETWRQIAPMLEAAMDSLSECDRNALMLRFFEGRALGEVSVKLGTSEDAAKKRISRALDKLRRFFMKRGVTSTTEIIGRSLSTYSIQPASAIMIKSIAAVALARGAGASAGTQALVKGAFKLFSWTKIAAVAGTAAIATVATVGVVASAGTTTFFVSWAESRNETMEQKIMRLSEPGTTLKDAIRILGEPTRYWRNNQQFDKKKLPDGFMVSYPRGVQASIWKGKVWEWEAVGQPAFTYHGKLRLGSTVDEVLSEVGPPAVTNYGATTKEVAGQRLGGYGGTFYQDINGKPGFCYYWRPDQNVRFVFRKNVVTMLVIDVPNFVP